MWRLKWEWDEALAGKGARDWPRSARSGLAENLLHAGVANPANERAARAHPSLASQNDREVKIRFDHR